MNSAADNALYIDSSVAPSIAKTPAKAVRIASIDLLRGLVIILMTLDHVRDYFHADAFLFSPLDLSQTTPALYFTRWITHFCAPVFVFLAGTSAYLVGIRRGSAELSSFLIKRGLWLVLAEFTIMNFAWFFNVKFSLLVFQVIGALGVGMIALAFISRLPYWAMLSGAVIVIGGHNLLDGIHVEGDGAQAVMWAWLHEFRGFGLGEDVVLMLGYPILPWTAIMVLGYCFGVLFRSDVDPGIRRRKLLTIGTAFIAAFFFIRSLNVYGDPGKWTVGETPVLTLLSFLNVQKYPPSLLYTLITLGPALIFLAFAERMLAGWTKPVLALGRAPFLYYILHVYLIHLLAVGAALITGFSMSDMVFNTWITDSPDLRGYGFGLPVVYALWIIVVLMLLPVCVKYDKYKTTHREKWWLSYL